MSVDEFAADTPKKGKSTKEAARSAKASKAEITNIETVDDISFSDPEEIASASAANSRTREKQSTGDHSSKPKRTKKDAKKEAASPAETSKAQLAKIKDELRELLDDAANDDMGYAGQCMDANHMRCLRDCA